MATQDMTELTHRGKGAAGAEVHDLQQKDEHSAESGTGYAPKQRLDRYIAFIPTIAFGATLQASWEAVALSFQAGLYNGGPVALVYGMIISWAGCAAIVASLAEMASVNPTVGAQYRWTALYAPRNVMSPAFWSLLQGWMTVFAWISTCAQPTYLNGTVIQGLIIFGDDSYVPQRWQGTLLAWAVLALPVICNIYCRRLLPPLEIIGGLAHVVFFLVFIVTLVVMAPRSTASFVFTESVSDLSGWQNVGVQFCIGQLSSAFPLTCFDGILHMSDEVKDAPRKVPAAMMWGIFINGLMAVAFTITILFTLGDLDTALTTPTGYPIIQVLYGATKSKPATFLLMAFLIFSGIIALFGGLASVSRLTWAFARDHGLPFSDFFGHVHPTLRIPLNSLALVSTIVALLCLINIGSSTAFWAILSLSTLALYFSYLMPIFFITLKKLRGEHIVYGPFKLGWWGIPINLFALGYGLFIAVFLPFPPTQPVTWVNLNYGGPVVGVVIILALLDWFTTGKKRFLVPVDKSLSDGNGEGSFDHGDD